MLQKGEHPLFVVRGQFLVESILLSCLGDMEGEKTSMAKTYKSR